MSWRDAFNSVAQRPFVRNVLAVAGGTAGAQAITMAFAPIVTRLYGPEAFGVQGTFLALVAIVLPLAALAYPIAIVLPKSDLDAQAIKRLSMLLAFAMASVLAVGLLFFSDAMADALGTELAAPFLWFLPLVVIFAAWQQVTQQWLIRKERFAALARIAVIQAFLVNAARVGLGLLSATAGMLVAVTTVGLGLHAAMQWWGGRQKRNLDGDRPSLNSAGGSWTTLRAQARAHKEFPLYRAPEMVLSAVSEGLPVLVLASAFGPAEAGFYALARSVLYLPVNLIGQSVANVFYPRLNAEAHTGRPLLPLLAKAWGGLAAIGLPLFITIAATSPWLFSLAFGADWHRAGAYASLLCGWLFVRFTNRPCQGATAVMSMQRAFLLQGVVAFILRAGGLCIGAFVLADDMWSVGLFSLASAFSAALLILFVAIRARTFNPA